MEFPNLGLVVEQVEELTSLINMHGLGLKVSAGVSINPPWKESTGIRHPTSVVTIYTLEAHSSSKRDTFRVAAHARQAIEDYAEMLEEIEGGELLKETTSACYTSGTKAYRLRGKMYIVYSVVGHGKVWWREEIDAAR